MNKEDKTSFWTAQIGLITAIIVLITTIIGLYSYSEISNNVPNSKSLNSSPIPTITPTFIPTPTITEIPMQSEGTDISYEWGIMDAYFIIISKPIREKTQITDVLGTVSEQDSISFIVESKTNFEAIVIFEAQFIDNRGVKLDSSFVYFDPDYSQWQVGERSKAYILIPSSTNFEKVKNIKFSKFF